MEGLRGEAREFHYCKHQNASTVFTHFSHIAEPFAVGEGDRLFNTLCTTWEISIKF